jgi:hypothetical protein
MDLPKLPINIDANLEAKSSRQTITYLFKINVTELEICHPTTFTRERSFFRTEKLDIVHAFADGSVRHTPIP